MNELIAMSTVTILVDNAIRRIRAAKGRTWEFELENIKELMKSNTVPTEEECVAPEGRSDYKHPVVIVDEAFWLGKGIK